MAERELNKYNTTIFKLYYSQTLLFKKNYNYNYKYTDIIIYIYFKSNII